MSIITVTLIIAAIVFVLAIAIAAILAFATRDETEAAAKRILAENAEREKAAHNENLRREQSKQYATGGISNDTPLIASNVQF